MSPQVTVDDFQRVEMRVGRIVRVDDFPAARKPSYQLLIDFGPHGMRRSSAAVRAFYAAGELLGRQVVAVVNFPPRRIAGFDSEVLVLGAVHADGRIVLLRPDGEAELGARIA